MRKVVLTILMTLLSHYTSGLQYPNCSYSCRRNDTVMLSQPPLSYTTMRSDEFTRVQPTNDECTPVDGQETVNCGVETTLMDCERGPPKNLNFSDLSPYFVWNRTSTSEVRSVSTVFRFDQPVNIGRISLWFWNAPRSTIDIPNVTLYSSNDDSTTPSNPITIDTSDSDALVENERYRLNVDITSGGLMIQSLRVMMSITGEGRYIALSEVLFCVSDVPATSSNTSTTVTTTATTTTTTTTSTFSAITKSTIAVPLSTATSTTTPVSSSSSSSTNIGVIVAPIIVIVLVAVVVVVLLIVFIWWRRRNKSNIYDDTTDLRKEAPYYSTVQHSSSVQNDDYYDDVKVKQSNPEVDRKPTLVYAVPDKGEKKEKRKSTEVKRNSSTDNRPQRSPEMEMHSREQTLSLMNSDYEHKMELDIYAAPDIPERTEASSIFDEIEDDPIYSEAINPSAIMSGRSHDSVVVGDMLCPYASIYADPMPLDKSEGPPIVSKKNIEILHQLGTGQFGEVILANTVGLSHQYLGIGNSSNSSISIKVAVKTLKADPTDEVQKSFEKEIKFMSRLKDDNVIRLLGICTSGTPFIMMEYMENGDLNQYLQQFEFTAETEKLPGPDEITLPALVYMCFQIASGMKYLSSHKFIHRDLATRNILVGIDYTVKIADFGMSQNLYTAYYYKVGGRIVLPIRWMAYECFFGKFSVKTDVWAFGITLWEIFTLCKFQPFYELSDQQIIEDAIKGKDRRIPQQPEVCPSDVYCIMKSCFPHEPSERAGFDVLCDQLNNVYTSLL